MALDATTAPAGAKKSWFRRKQVVRAAEIVVSLGLVVGIFAGILPKIADYSTVWTTVGALATGVSYTMYRSWGFRNSEIVLSALVTGVWNTFIKLATPVLALVALLATATPPPR